MKGFDKRSGDPSSGAWYEPDLLENKSPSPWIRDICLRKDTCQLVMVVGQCTQTSLVHVPYYVIFI